MDRENVIKGLEACSQGECTTVCPYHNTPRCSVVILEDALALLNDQEDMTEAFNETVERCRKYMEKCGAIPMPKEKRLFFADGKGNITPLPEIVRCKDCKHGQYEEWDNGECVDKTVYCDGYGIHKPDWFCADGEHAENAR